MLQTTPLETRIGPSHRCVALASFASKSDKKRSLQKGTYFSRKIDDDQNWEVNLRFLNQERTVFASAARLFVLFVIFLNLFVIFLNLPTLNAIW